MNLYECEEFFKNMYPNKKITFEFDKNCHREVTFVFTKGEAHDHAHLCFNHVKVTVEGIPPQYCPIQPHRMVGSWNEVKSHINAPKEFYINDQELHAFSDLQDLPDNHTDKWQLETKIGETLAKSEITRDKLLNKIKDYKVNRKPKI